MVVLENIDIDIDIDKAILQNIDIDKISNRFKFGISNRASSVYPITRGRETEGDGKNIQSTEASSESPEGQRHLSAFGEQ